MRNGGVQVRTQRAPACVGRLKVQGPCASMREYEHREALSRLVRLGFDANILQAGMTARIEAQRQKELARLNAVREQEAREDRRAQAC